MHSGPDVFTKVHKFARSIDVFLVLSMHCTLKKKSTKNMHYELKTKLSTKNMHVGN